MPAKQISLTQNINKKKFVLAIEQLYNTLPGYHTEMPSSKFKSQLQALLHKNSFYCVNAFKEYFQNKD